MAERKNTQFDRHGGYAMPKGATAVQREAAKDLTQADIRLYGDTVPPHDLNRQSSRQGSPAGLATIVNRQSPAFQASDPDTRLYIGDCRDILHQLPDKGNVDLIFADPPFNWDVPYAGSEEKGIKASRDQGIKRSRGEQSQPLDASMPRCLDAWNDRMPRAEYERFTFDWLDGCIECLAPHGSLWVNIPDDTAAEVVLHLKRRGLTMINWCIWHFRFGQNRSSSFIMSKVHALYFAKNGGIKASRHEGIKGQQGSATNLSLDASMPGCLDASPSPGRIWNPDAILEQSDRASIYFDPRTMAKDSNKGLRVPMDVWYGKYWGRVQGNNKERRHTHHNQIPEIYLERVIKACSNPAGESGDAFGSLVLDPFCGSGTTSTVARALGRRSITIEYSEVNAKSAWRRILKGPVRLNEAPMSSAIFAARNRGSKTVALWDKVLESVQNHQRPQK